MGTVVMEVTQLLPLRPYLLRAFYEWLLNNHLTPHLIVDTTMDKIVVPMEFVSDKHIILNIAPRAVVNLTLGNDDIRFNARFNNIYWQVVVPIMAVLAIYASENSTGIMFEPEIVYERLMLDGNRGTEKPIMGAVVSVIDSNQLNNIKETDNFTDQSYTTLHDSSRPSLRIVK